jgi:hypothetical protein
MLGGAAEWKSFYSVGEEPGEKPGECVPKNGRKLVTTPEGAIYFLEGGE